MGALAAPRMIGWRAALRLGRVSNLPTIWSNVIASAALAGGASVRVLIISAVAMSLLYVGGMYLNDAFDRDVDVRERPSRPIPSGEVTVTTVFAIGFGMLALAVILLAMLGLVAALIGLVLAGAIVLYDWHHKGNAWGPLLMGFCRALVYIGTAAAIGAALAPSVLAGASVMFLYVASLTFASKRGYPAIGLLIAAIALVDALAAATTGATTAALVCVGLFFLTLLLQRYVPGT